MGRIKKIGIGVGIIIVIMIVISILGTLVSDDSKLVSDDSKEQSTTTSSTKSILDLLPTRQDIGPEQYIRNLEYYKNDALDGGYVGNSSAHIDGSVKGYLESVRQTYTSDHGFMSVTKITVTIVRFDSSTNAKNYYNTITTKIYDKGGFKQFDTRGINAKCFSVLKEASLASISDLYCVKENVYYTIEGYTTTIDDITTITIKFAKIITDKIAERIGMIQMSFIDFAKRICSDDEDCITTLVIGNHDISACNILSTKDLSTKDICIIKYVTHFNEPEKCKEAVNEIFCIETASLTLGINACNIIYNEKDKIECMQNYITRAPLTGYYNNDEIKNVCSPTFPFSSHLVLYIVCKLERLYIDDTSKNFIRTWTTSDKLTICTHYEVYNHLSSYDPKMRNDYCLAFIGVYLKDISICDQAGEARAECYSFIALTDKSVNLKTCNKLEGTGRTFCYMFVAYRLNDISICDKADTHKEDCIRLINSRIQ